MAVLYISNLLVKNLIISLLIANYNNNLIMKIANNNRLNNKMIRYSNNNPNNNNYPSDRNKKNNLVKINMLNVFIN